jgi:Flp pilus assembly protein TadD
MNIRSPYTLLGATLLLFIVGAIIQYNQKQNVQESDSASTTVITVDPNATSTNVGGYTVERIIEKDPRQPSITRTIPKYTPDLSSEARAVAIANIEMATKNLANNPQSYNDWMTLGSMRNILGDYAGAADAWNFAGVIAPNQSRSFANVGFLYATAIKDFKKAETAYLRAIKNDPKDPGLFSNLFDLYVTIGFKESAGEDVLLQGIRENPRSYELRVILARYYVKVGKIANAKSQFESAALAAEAAGATEIARNIRTESSSLK